MGRGRVGRGRVGVGASEGPGRVKGWGDHGQGESGGAGG